MNQGALPPRSPLRGLFTCFIVFFYRICPISWPRFSWQWIDNTVLSHCIWNVASILWRKTVDRYETWNFKSTKHYETVKDGPEVDSTNCVVLHKKIYS